MDKHFTITFPKEYLSIGHYDSDIGKVPVIRTIRQLSGCGLKEAKDISEITSPQTIGLIGILNDDVFTAFKMLERNGCKITSPVYSILAELRVLATQAMKQGEDELASEILQLITAEKLRRKQ
jgi:hypothetical protein